MHFCFLIIIHSFFIFKFYEFSFSFFRIIINLFYYLKKKYLHKKNNICLQQIKTDLIKKIGKDVYYHILTKEQSISLLINENTQIEIYSSYFPILMKNLNIFTLIYTIFTMYYVIVHKYKFECTY
jgi:hypothetical protein